MKTIIIRLSNGKFFAEGINFDVCQFSKIGCIMDIYELINFCNTNRVTIKNKTSIKQEFQNLLKY